MKNDFDILGNMPAPTVNPFDYPEVKCDECGCVDFKGSVRFRKVPGLLVGSTEEVYYPHKVYVCASCGKLSPVSKKEIEEISKMSANSQPASNQSDSGIII